MSYGKQRNEAELIALYNQVRGIPYEVAHTNYYVRFQASKDIIKWISRCFESFNSTIQNATAAIAKLDLSAAKFKEREKELII